MDAIAGKAASEAACTAQGDSTPGEEHARGWGWGWDGDARRMLGRSAIGDSAATGDRAATQIDVTPL